MAKPIKSPELHYPMIQFLIKLVNVFVFLSTLLKQPQRIHNVWTCGFDDTYHAIHLYWVN